MKLIQNLIMVFISLIIIACQNGKEDSKKQLDLTPTNATMNLPDSLSARRISFVLNLRKAVANKVWKKFAEKEVEGAFIYFNGNKSEIFFPSSQVLNSLETYDSYSEDYVLAPRTDSIPYHFELMISFNVEDSTKLYYNHPVQQFLSVEETGNYIPVKSSEMWSNMVIHEMFHHFQYNNPNFQAYAKTKIGLLPYDIRDLIKLCNEDKDFLKLVQGENDLLLKAIEQSDSSKRNILIKNYLEARSSRIAKYGKQDNYLEQVENYYVIQEGSARYMEYNSIMELNELAQKANPPIIKNDPRFLSYAEFKEVDLNGDEFNYLNYASPTTYHYAIGFNILRLLDELEIRFTESLLNNPDKGLHTYLEDYLNSLDQ